MDQEFIESFIATFKDFNVLLEARVREKPTEPYRIPIEVNPYRSYRCRDLPVIPAS